jgi:hypothetical protein
MAREAGETASAKEGKVGLIVEPLTTREPTTGGVRAKEGKAGNATTSAKTSGTTATRSTQIAIALGGNVERVHLIL